MTSEDFVIHSIWETFSGLEEREMKKFKVSPDGRFLVFLGKTGGMHLLSAKVSVITPHQKR
jgi:hypothetical protein